MEPIKSSGLFNQPSQPSPTKAETTLDIYTEAVSEIRLGNANPESLLRSIGRLGQVDPDEIYRFSLYTKALINLYFTNTVRGDK